MLEWLLVTLIFAVIDACLYAFGYWRGRSGRGFWPVDKSSPLCYSRSGRRTQMSYEDRLDFQDPGGRSALRRATRSNPRNLPCPTCGQPNRLTPADRRRGYQCDQCADRAEGTYSGGDY